MATFTKHTAGSPSWVDLMSSDVDASKAFYTAVFGWECVDQFDDDGTRIYTLCNVDGRATAGIGDQPPGMGDMPAVWNTYIATDDPAATAAAVTKAGGTVMMPPMQVMTSGEMAVFADPTGAVFSIWKAGDHTGAEIGNVANTYSWNELVSRDIETCKTFYSEVFGWTYDSGAMPDGSYSVIEGGDEGWGGLMAMPDEMPPMVPNHWAAYFTVANIDESLAAIEAAGGAIVMPKTTMPGVGTFAAVHDTINASFYVIQPEAA